jgi:hypothetical protein
VLPAHVEHLAVNTFSNRYRGSITTKPPHRLYRQVTFALGIWISPQRFLIDMHCHLVLVCGAGLPLIAASKITFGNFDNSATHCIYAGKYIF